MKLPPWCAAFLLLAGFSCFKKNGDRLFTSMAPEISGIYFNNTVPEVSPGGMNIIQYLYYYNGGGVAAGDVNNDGLTDLYFGSNIGENTLYLNRGGFHFEAVSAGVEDPGEWKTGVSMADVNADGRLDIYVCRVGNYKNFKGKNRLFINNGLQNGALSFTESAAEFGLDFSGFSTQAAFFDFDLDGDLDCFLLNHSIHSPESYKDTSVARRFDPAASDRLYRNDKGRFTDITTSAGLRDGAAGYGLGIAVGDLNADGYPDVYVGNDFHENDFVYLNEKGLRFRESSADYLGHCSNFTMGCDIADFDNDALPDILTLDMKPESEEILKASQPADPYPVHLFKLGYGYRPQFPRNCLQRNTGAGFSEIGQLAGVATTDWSWSALFADFDLDGYKDIFVSNGIPRRPNDNDFLKFISAAETQQKASDLDLIRKMPDGAVQNYAFQNNGNLQFNNISEAWGLAEKGCSNGAVYADFDNDGDLDLAYNNLNKTASLFRNESRNRRFLRLQLAGAPANPFAIGAKVRVYTGSEMQYFENQPTRGFQSSVEPGLITVGLGKYSRIDSLKVDWPEGITNTFFGLEANQTLSVKPEKTGGATVQRTTHPLFEVGETLHFHSSVDSAATAEFARDKLIPWSPAAVAPTGWKTNDGSFIINGRRLLPSENDLLVRASNPTRFPPACLDPETFGVWPCDYDMDGDEDYFITKKSPFFGMPAEAALWSQIAPGQFEEKTPPAIKSCGGTQAVWADLDGDRRPDLVTGGYWTTLRIYYNRPTGFDPLEIPDSEGLWSAFAASDMDGDGDTDFVAGNFGLNHNLSATHDEPLGLWIKDFDQNGFFDPILTYYRQGKNRVYVDKDLLTSQIPSLKKKYVEYKAYSESDFNGVFPLSVLKNAVERKVQILETCWLENLGHRKWAVHVLPAEAQISPVFAILTGDFNSDGHIDLLLGGNLTQASPSIGRMDASRGGLLWNTGNGTFTAASQAQSGLRFRGDVRAFIPRNNGFAAVYNDGRVEMWQKSTGN